MSTRAAAATLSGVKVIQQECGSACLVQVYIKWIIIKARYVVRKQRD